MSKYTCDLSIIIITRNEEEIIRDCITSVLAALEYAKAQEVLESSEVILVDSASTDGTIEIAKQFPISVIRLDSSIPLSASAGMYIGVLNSNGRFLAKVDGDTIVFKDWFAKALPYLENERIAGVTGIFKEEVSDNTMIGAAYSKESENQPAGKVDVIATGIFNKKILLKAGSFNPFLKAGEDRDICWRISELGYEFIRIPYFEIQHYLVGKNQEMTYVEHLQKMFKYSVGDGQAAKFYINNIEILKKYVFRYATIYFANAYIMIFLWINLFYSNYLFFSNHSFSPHFIFMVDFLVITLALFILTVKYQGKGQKLKGVMFTFEVIPYMITRHLGFVIGLMKRKKNPSDYPLKMETIKSQ
jgi:glycosyltransferase involved in cell wall biosynthesis